MLKISRVYDESSVKSVAARISSTSYWLHAVNRIKYIIYLISTYPTPIYYDKSFPWRRVTVLEIVVILVTGIMLIQVAYYGGKRVAGRIADYTTFMLICLGIRNDLSRMIMGLTTEKALFWHKSLTMTVTCFTILHVYQNHLDRTGVVWCCLIALMGMTYLIKHANFECFYWTHLTCFLAMIPVAWIHGAEYTTFGGGLWILNVLCRYSLISRSSNSPSFELLPGDIVKLTIDKTFSYQAGQYCFIMIPEISSYEFHPFSISSSPNEDKISFHIRALGDWTKRLCDHVKAGKSLSSRIEGPYGQLAVNIEDPSYNIFILISGGIGVTPLRSIYNQLVDEQSKGRKLRKVLFVWAVKEQVLLSSMTYASDTEKPFVKHHSSLPLSFQPDMSPCPKVRMENESLDEVLGTNIEQIDDRDIESSSQDSDLDGSNPYSSDQIFQAEYYLTATGTRSSKGADSPSFNDDMADSLRWGRPNVEEIFDNLMKFSMGCRSVSKVAVFVCGPVDLVNEVDEYCRRTTITVCNKVQFHCHKEVFNF
jgi:hypothetical protein